MINQHMGPFDPRPCGCKAFGRQPVYQNVHPLKNCFAFCDLFWRFQLRCAEINVLGLIPGGAFFNSSAQRLTSYKSMTSQQLDGQVCYLHKTTSKH